MRKRRLTGSKLHRVWRCAASAVLPQNESEEAEERSEPARGRGQVIHTYLETVRRDGRDEAVSRVPAEHQPLCRALDIDRLPTHLSCEVAFAWRWADRIARELGRGGAELPRRDDNSIDYDALGVDWDTEIPGTIDVTGMAEVSPPGSMDTVRRGYVGDYKTGWTKYPRPAKFAQTLIAAACIRSIWSLDDVIGEVLYIDDKGDCFPQRDLISGDVLDAFELEIAELMGDLPELDRLFAANGGGALAKREGDHCQYCSAWKDCSAKTALVRAVPEELLKLGARRGPNGDFALVWTPELGEDGKPKSDGRGTWDMQISPGAITVRNAAAVYEACERIEALCRRMRDEVCSIAYHEPIELSDGRVIERYTWRKREVDGPSAVAILERHYGRDKVIEKVDVKISLGAIEDLVRENIDWNQKPRPVIHSKKGTGVLDKLLDELQRAGAIAVATGEEVKPHRIRGGSKKSG